MLVATAMLLSCFTVNHAAKSESTQTVNRCLEPTGYLLGSDKLHAQRMGQHKRRIGRACAERLKDEKKRRQDKVAERLSTSEETQTIVLEGVRTQIKLREML